ncbi:MAG: hypothetical protein EXR70_19640 [Deltaproteobacteria bacterium]|nr:hypothetical protein [Deltaproteobacteria bacterium]
MQLPNPNIPEKQNSARLAHIDRGLEAIAIFKLVKGALLVIVGTGAAKLVHVDVYDLALQ